MGVEWTELFHTSTQVVPIFSVPFSGMDVCIIATKVCTYVR